MVRPLQSHGRSLIEASSSARIGNNGQSGHHRNIWNQRSSSSVSISMTARNVHTITGSKSISSLGDRRHSLSNLSEGPKQPISSVGSAASPLGALIRRLVISPERCVASSCKYQAKRTFAFHVQGTGLYFSSDLKFVHKPLSDWLLPNHYIEITKFTGIRTPFFLSGTGSFYYYYALT
jgi:hypothetical protein